MKAVLVIGGGGHCRACIDVIEAEGRYRVAGIVDPDRKDASSQLGYEWLGTDDDLPRLIREYPLAFVAVGQVKTPDGRIAIHQRLTKLGAEFPVIISPRAYVSNHATISPGTIVMHGAIVNTGARIGENCIINSQALIEHDAVVGAHCHISTGAKLNGGVHVDVGCFIGSGAVVRHDVRISRYCVVGAGATVMENLPESTVYRGNR